MKTSYVSNEPWMSTKEPGIDVPFLIFIGQMILFWSVVALIEGSNEQCCQKCCCRKNQSFINDNEWDDSVRKRSSLIFRENEKKNAQRSLLVETG